MARTFSQHGVWGISPDGFASTSSSPLWTLVLSLAFLVFGPAAAAPLVLNIVFAAGLLALVYFLARRARVPDVGIFIALLAVILFTPLLPLVFCGIEHVLHAGLTILFASATASALAAGPLPASVRNRVLLLAPLIVMARFESLFLIGIAALLFFIRKRAALGAGTLALGILPLAVYGYISIANGWFFLPNSVLLKGRLPETLTPAGVAGLLGDGAAAAWKNPHILVLFAAVLAVLIVRGAKGSPISEHQELFFDPPAVFGVLFLAATAAHLVFAQLGWFYRYEAYLLALGTTALLLGGRDLAPAFSRSASPAVRFPALLALIIVVFVLGLRGGRASLEVPRATRNIYEQQVQVATFIKKHYDRTAVALNDIGAVNWIADIHSLDLWGLADRDVARARLAGTYGPETMARLAERAGVRIAVVYDEWFDRFGGLPASWVKVGRWTIDDNIVCGGPSVAFYAVRPGEARNLAEVLTSFQKELPSRVAWRITLK